MATRTENAEAISRHARVSARRAHREGATGTRVTRMYLIEVAQRLGLTGSVDYTMRTVISRVRADAKLLGQEWLLGDDVTGRRRS